MLTILPHPLRGAVAASLLVLNTLVIATTLVVPALIKLVLPVEPVRRLCDRARNALASDWVANNNRWIAAVRPARSDVQGTDNLHARGW